MSGMIFDRDWLRIALIVISVFAAPQHPRAGGVNFGDDDQGTADKGPAYFGFVREVGGPVLPTPRSRRRSRRAARS